MYAASDDTEYLQIRNDPIVMPDPGDFHIPTRAISPKPYLRRGTGLQRYQMSVDYFKKGPPDLYKREEFKSFLRKDQPKKQSTNKIPKVTNTSRPCLKSQPVAPPKPAQPRSFPERKYALNTMKCFDDEVIPSLRGRTNNEAFHVLIDPVESLSRNSAPLPKIPNTPIKKLILKSGDIPDSHALSNGVDENDVVAEDSSESDENDFESQPTSARRLVYHPELNANSNNHRIGQCCEGPQMIESNQGDHYGVLDKESNDAPNGRRLGEDSSESDENDFESQPSSARRLVNHPELNANSNNHRIGQYCVGPQLIESNQGDHYGVLDEESNDAPNVRRRGAQQIAMAMKHKGLTDNVKKHLAWNVTPRKKRFTKIIKLKKRKSPVKKEKYTIHEYKQKLTLLLEENKKLQADNYKMKVKEKEVQDEKMKILKTKRDNENSIKIARQALEEDRKKLIEGQKKLKREKAVFDQYCQETRNLPSREDRELIRNLKEEILKLKEEQKTKDIRVGAAQAQMRNRVVFLENENKELKKDLEMAQRITSKKAVRFESIGNIRSKVINAINDHLDENIKPRPRSAGERPTSTFKPSLRRSKSAVELKLAAKTNGNRKRGVSANPTAPEKVKSVEIEVIANDIENDESDKEDLSSAPEVIDLVGKPSIYAKDGNDSGVGSKYSSENSPTRSGHVLGGSAESDMYFSHQQSKIYEKNIYGCHIHEEREDLRSRKTDCLGCMPSHEKQPSPTRQHPLQWEKYTPTLNITTESSISSPLASSLHSSMKTTGSGSNGMCARHGCPRVADASRMWSSCLQDRDVVRTQLASGDVEEEELHTGVRRVLCGACAAVEISYRNRPGYRRTNLPQEEILEEHPNGVAELRRKNGEVLRKYPNGDRLLIMANGDKELTTRGYKKLETVNGTVKIVFDSGRTETRYRSGRVRVKDESGHLIMDTGGLPCS